MEYILLGYKISFMLDNINGQTVTTKKNILLYGIWIRSLETLPIFGEKKKEEEKKEKKKEWDINIGKWSIFSNYKKAPTRHLSKPFFKHVPHAL